MSDKKLPEGLPPLPEGAVYLGEAKQFKRNIGDDFFGWSSMVGEPKWVYGRHMGTMPHVHYAAPIGSPIAILNGHSPEIKEEGENLTNNSILFRISDYGNSEILRLDKYGMTYKGRRIEDAGSAYSAFMEVMGRSKKAFAGVHAVEIQRDDARRERDEWKKVAHDLKKALRGSAIRINAIFNGEEETSINLLPGESIPTALENIDACGNAVSAYEALNQKEQSS